MIDQNFHGDQEERKVQWADGNAQWYDDIVRLKVSPWMRMTQDRDNWRKKKRPLTTGVLIMIMIS